MTVFGPVICSSTNEAWLIHIAIGIVVGSIVLAILVSVELIMVGLAIFVCPLEKFPSRLETIPIV